MTTLFDLEANMPPLVREWITAAHAYKHQQSPKNHQRLEALCREVCRSEAAFEALPEDVLLGAHIRQMRAAFALADAGKAHDAKALESARRDFERWSTRVLELTHLPPIGSA